MKLAQKLSPCLWFDDQAEAAVQLYTSTFPNSTIGTVTRYTEAGQEIHGHEAGTVLTVQFELDGQPFMALNGGPMFKFTEAVSFQVFCETQEEVDYYWEKLTDGGDEDSQQCGWLKDKFGLSWQVVPTVWMDIVTDPDTEKVMKATDAMMGMKKLDIAKLQEAFNS